MTRGLVPPPPGGLVSAGQPLFYGLLDRATVIGSRTGIVITTGQPLLEAGPGSLSHWSTSSLRRRAEAHIRAPTLCRLGPYLAPASSQGIHSHHRSSGPVPQTSRVRGPDVHLLGRYINRHTSCASGGE